MERFCIFVANEMKFGKKCLPTIYLQSKIAKLPKYLYILIKIFIYFLICSNLAHFGNSLAAVSLYVSLYYYRYYCTPWSFFWEVRFKNTLKDLFLIVKNMIFNISNLNRDKYYLFLSIQEIFIKLTIQNFKFIK